MDKRLLVSLVKYSNEPELLKATTEAIRNYDKEKTIDNKAILVLYLMILQGKLSIKEGEHDKVA